MPYREPTLTSPRAARTRSRLAWPTHAAILALLAAPVAMAWREVLWPPPPPELMTDGYAMGRWGVDMAALILGGSWVAYAVITTGLVATRCSTLSRVLGCHAAVMGAIFVLVRTYW